MRKNKEKDGHEKVNNLTLITDLEKKCKITPHFVTDIEKADFRQSSDQALQRRLALTKHQA